jgi:hypothetical protein
MRTFTYEFSVLEPIASNDEFPHKATPPIYPTLLSIFSIKRLCACYYIDAFAKRGKFMKPGRYRLEVVFFGAKMKAKLNWFV